MKLKFFSWIMATGTRKSIALAAGIFSSTILVAIICLTTMYRMANRLYQPLQQSNQLRDRYIMADDHDKKNAVPKLDYLRLQYRNIEYYKEHHKEMGKIYYANYYTFTVLLTVSTILTAILIFQIAETGRKEASLFQKVAFFCFFSISTFLGIMTVTLDQKNNYQNNFGQYIYYDKIQNNILTFVNTTGPCDSLHPKCQVDSFIIALNNDLRNNNQFFITIDANKISLDDITGKLGKAINGNKPAQ